MNFKKIAVLGLVGASALLLSACSYGMSKNNSSSTTTQQSSSSGQVAEVVITFSDGGILPTESVVQSGGKIKWVNNSSKKISVASDPHPTHTDNQELTNNQFILELAPGASSEVTVTKKGTWGYHDHLNPSTKGKVTVQ
ncbi:MAG TPA: cupredoxin domain-containing protein [Candidatus Saccharimonadales bacterium]|nr:cupredoxin domain-containing protein [Candidatus Saccharimonadales bacterium]